MSAPCHANAGVAAVMRQRAQAEASGRAALRGDHAGRAYSCVRAGAETATDASAARFRSGASI